MRTTEAQARRKKIPLRAREPIVRAVKSLCDASQPSGQKTFQKKPRGVVFSMF